MRYENTMRAFDAHTRDVIGVRDFFHAAAPPRPRRPPPPVSVPAMDNDGIYPVTAVNADGAKGYRCTVCLEDDAVNTSVQPCGHTEFCRACALRMRSEGKDKCPICNVKIECFSAFILGARAASPPPSPPAYEIANDGRVVAQPPPMALDSRR